MFAQHQEQIKNIFENGNGGVFALVDEVKIEMQRVQSSSFLQQEKTGIEEMQQVQNLEGMVQNLCWVTGAQGFKLTQQVQKVTHQVQVMSQQMQQQRQRLDTFIAFCGKAFSNHDLLLKRIQCDLEQKI